MVTSHKKARGERQEEEKVLCRKGSMCGKEDSKTVITAGKIRVGGGGGALEKKCPYDPGTKKSPRIPHRSPRREPTKDRSNGRSRPEELIVVRIKRSASLTKGETGIRGGEK